MNRHQFLVEAQHICDSFLERKEYKKRVATLLSDIPTVTRMWQRASNLKLSLVMLVRDQETLVRQALESLAPEIIDEYIVIDTGSKDRTAEQLRDFDFVKVFHQDWQEDYARMRNEAAAFAHADWVLTLDADEVLLSRDVPFKVLISLLEELIRQPFSIAFEQHYPHRADYGTPERLYCPQSSRYFGLVHEEVREKSGLKPVVKVRTRIKIDNKGTTASEEEKLSKDARYTHLLQEMFKKEPENPRWISFLSVPSLHDDKEVADYDRLLIHHLFKEGRESYFVDRIKHHNYTRTLLERYASRLLAKQAYSEALTFIETALKISPNDTYLLFFQSVARVERIKQEIKETLKETLSNYFSIDKDLSYDLYHQDSQMLLLSVAECERLLGRSEVVDNILSSIEDQRSQDIWQAWHAELNRQTAT